MLSHGRGICGVCGKERIKALYEQEIGGEKKMICKFCKAAIKNGKKSA
jgi:hypothetical protein